jgi:hypothetical protein
VRWRRHRSVESRYDWIREEFYARCRWPSHGSRLKWIERLRNLAIWTSTSRRDRSTQTLCYHDRVASEGQPKYILGTRIQLVLEALADKYSDVAEILSREVQPE